MRRRKGTIFARHLSDIVQVRKCTSCSFTDGYWDKLTRFYSTKNSCGKNFTPGKKYFKSIEDNLSRVLVRDIWDRRHKNLIKLVRNGQSKMLGYFVELYSNIYKLQS